jgi:hypothetical protein
MGWIREHRPSPATAFGFAALMVALGGVAFAAMPDSDGTIHGCVQKNTGNLRVVESSSDCRSSEQAIDWNQGNSSGVRVLKPVSLSPGDRRILFQTGSVTFTAFCKAPGVDNEAALRANVEVTTTQDHAAVVEDGFRLANRDLSAGQTWTLFGPGSGNSGTEPNLSDMDFMAFSPDGTHATGILSLGVNLGGSASRCQFGGQVAVAKET